ncbi:MAG TPA: hypothetical protein VK017_07715 [Sphingobacterium sp.]|nr:hypothetical protein [Sphingobacterium sp.]
MDEIILHIRLRRAQPDMEVASCYGGIRVVQSLSTDRRGNGLRQAPPDIEVSSGYGAVGVIQSLSKDGH